MSDSRAAFETFISLPPYEKEISRFPDDGSSAWPGSYKNLIVDLAWNAWQASRQAVSVPDNEYIRALQDAFDIIQADANTEQNYESLCRIGGVLARLKSNQEQDQ